MTDTWPLPPDSTVWWDPAATEQAVLAALRLTETDVDIERIRASIPAAGAAINAYLDRLEPIAGPPPPDGLQTALEAAAVEVYHYSGVAATVGTGPTQLAGASSQPFDPLRDLHSQLLPYRQRWGLS